MLPCGCKPDGMTYGILISAYDKGNQWCLALQVCFFSPLSLFEFNSRSFPDKGSVWRSGLQVKSPRNMSAHCNCADASAHEG